MAKRKQRGRQMHSRERRYKRRVVGERDGERCAHCGREDVPLTLDHIVPCALGGKHNLPNLQLLCLPCNQAKADSDPETTTTPERVRRPRVMEGFKR